MKEKFRQGKYRPEHPEKYIGDITNIQFRSSWELQAFQFLDRNPNVKKWASEEIKISYIKPLPDGSLKPSLYIPDLYVEYVNKKGQYIREMIEVKPVKYTQASTAKRSKTRLNENYIYVVNLAKFEAADRWCKPRGIKFTVLTENQLFGS